MEPLYPEIYPWIARLLQDSARNVADSYFDLDIGSEIRESLPSGVVYADLVEPDRARVQEAVGYLVAARNRAPLATGGAAKELASEKTETTSRGFSGGGTLDDEWRSHARGLLRRCSFAPPTASAAPGAPGGFYAANGPSRAAAVRRERRR